VKCFYHDDMDGRCAGAIAHRFMRNQEDDGTGFQYMPINYKDVFPFDAIRPNEQVIIVDFSLQRPGEFQQLLEITRRIVWIDHHITAIEKHGDIQVAGIRRDGTAGCELAWEFFYPGYPVPPVVQLLGDYDVWKFQFGEASTLLQAGIRLYNTNPKSEDWERWLNPEYYPTEELEKGEIALRYRDNYYAGLVKSWGFWTEIEGHKAIACNAGSVSSQLFDTVEGDYDIMIAFVFDGKQWTVSLYSQKVDVSQIAKKYGGGGHKGAAGFQCKELPFVKG
jgi:oligoribonuclease NrnB/cAMP/cGMP phosphodiesterase (DHH superfamily)